MMQNEFESIIGFRVDNRVYETIIEPMYTAVSMNKWLFCKMFNKTYLKKMICKGCVGALTSVAVDSVTPSTVRVAYGILKNKYRDDWGNIIYELTPITHEQVREFRNFGRELPEIMDYFEVDVPNRKCEIAKWI